MKTMKKKLAVAVTVALLAFPLSTALTMADTAIPTTVTPNTAVPTTTTSATTASVITVPATTELQAKAAEAAVAAYEARPITTLVEVANAERLKAAADTAVAVVGDVAAKTAFELRIKNRAAAIATAKISEAPVVDANGNTVTTVNWFTDLISKIQLALTFDPARQCELNEQQALVKLAEAQKLMKDGKPEAAQLSFNQYADTITKAQAFLDQVKDPTSNEAKALDDTLVKVNSNNIQVLSNLLDKLPPQAAQKLALNVVRSMEKAVNKIQKEDAKVAIQTTSSTTPVVTAVADSKVLENQAKVTLETFKKSLNQKGKIHMEDQDQDQDQKDNGNKNIQSTTVNQPIHVMVAPVKPQLSPTITQPSEHSTEIRSKQAENGKNKGEGKEDSHRDNK